MGGNGMEANEIWVGSYSPAQKCFDIRTLDELADTEMDNFRRGVIGETCYTPLVIGKTQRECRVVLDYLKAEFGRP